MLYARCDVCDCGPILWRNPAEYVAHVFACEQIDLGLAADQIDGLTLTATSRR